MITNVKVKNGHEIHVRHELTPEELTVLKHLKEHGYMEFRNGGDAITDDLYDRGFVKSDDMAWHYTVKLTELGKAVVEQFE